jgi:hypothetical protein
VTGRRRRVEIDRLVVHAGALSGMEALGLADLVAEELQSRLSGLDGDKGRDEARGRGLTPRIEPVPTPAPTPVRQLARLVASQVAAVIETTPSTPTTARGSRRG